MTEGANAAPLLGRIFLVGVPRSGTTLLQALLAAHPDITSFTESHFFSRCFTALPGLGAVLRDDPTPRLHEFLAENQADTPPAAAWFGPPSPAALRLPPLRPAATNEVARRLVNVLDELARQRGAAFWLEKTPRHLQRLELIRRACRDDIPTQFVHLVRRGPETVASLFDASKHWERAYDLDECIRRWNDDLAITLTHLDEPGHHVVLYEALTRDPESELRRLLGRLGLPWAPTLLADYARGAGALATPGESWKQGTARAIAPSSRVEEVLDPAQRDVVWAGIASERYEQVAAHALPGSTEENGSGNVS